METKRFRGVKRKMFIQCSNCGKHNDVTKSYEMAEVMYLAGYRAVGDALYCPDCVKSWKERNGGDFDEMYDNPMAMFFRWFVNKR